MKFKVLAIVLVLICVLAFAAACNNAQVESTGGIYSTLNEMVKKEYSHIDLMVTMTDGAQSLSGEYSVTKENDVIRIDYEYEQLSTFQEIDGVLIAPESEVETKSGSLTLRGDVVVDAAGDELNLPKDIVTTTGFSFDAAYFQNVAMGNARFSADVINTEKFIGIKEVSNMKVTVDYETELKNISIEYNKSGKNYSLTYTFA